MIELAISFLIASLLIGLLLYLYRDFRTGRLDPVSLVAEREEEDEEDK